ncbi:AraC family transcriptional regulator [Bacterioplanes sanyensis]|uniref:AraC family transcriptional regulator n=1 Tax=Bacterioplanes sanyensis TaxID=1249553 RepID=A0A222FJH9_9GAMM|nr:AraC family transcriptional regulator [Bacterioplanes sanyensis]ASP38802.1 AraC family transcriptional regulator [Bacterioplanes sanyensis]
MDQIHYYQPQPDIRLIDANYQTFAFQRHYHLDFHIGLITKGAQTFRYRGHSHTAHAGQLVLMPPDELHDGEAWQQQGYQVNVFAIDPVSLSELADLRSPEQLLHFQQLIVHDASVFAVLQQAHQWLRQTQLSQLAQDCLPLEGFNLLFERYGALARQPVKRLGRQSLAELKSFLMAHLDQPVRLASLANLCDLSTTQLQRHFKATTGMTPYAWFAQLRLEQSMKLLQRGDAVADVAQQVGFYDQAHFCKAFKRQFGVAPSCVRQ